MSAAAGGGFPARLRLYHTSPGRVEPAGSYGDGRANVPGSGERVCVPDPCSPNPKGGGSSDEYTAVQAPARKTWGVRGREPLSGWQWCECGRDQRLRSRGGAREHSGERGSALCLQGAAGPPG